MIGVIAGAIALALIALAAWTYATRWRPDPVRYPIQGVDVSDAQGAIDWNAVAAHGADFAYIRATAGAGQRDNRFDANWQAAAAAGLRRGAFHVWSFCAGGIAQADNFVTTVPRVSGALPATLDIAFRSRLRRATGACRADLATGALPIDRRNAYGRTHAAQDFQTRRSRLSSKRCAPTPAMGNGQFPLPRLRRPAMADMAGIRHAAYRRDRRAGALGRGDAVSDPTLLIDAARRAAQHAHAPYSGFAVGAALLLNDGSIVTGCNFENASYGLSLCAETVALATANASGRLRDVMAVAVVGGAIAPNGEIGGEVPVRPCGRCRQVLNEAAQMGGRDLVIHCTGGRGGATESYRLSDLLPQPFGPADLGL